MEPHAAMATSAEHDTDHLTIRYQDGADGWVTATIVEEPAAISQGRTRAEAYENVLDALHDLRHDASLEVRATHALDQARVEVTRRLAQVMARLRKRAPV